jgi:hypothetical protein
MKLLPNIYLSLDIKLVSELYGQMLHIYVGLLVYKMAFSTIDPRSFVRHSVFATEPRKSCRAPVRSAPRIATSTLLRPLA